MDESSFSLSAALFSISVSDANAVNVVPPTNKSALLSRVVEDRLPADLPIDRVIILLGIGYGWSSRVDQLPPPAIDRIEIDHSALKNLKLARSV